MGAVFSCRKAATKMRAFFYMGNCIKPPARAKLRCFTNNGGSEGGLSLLLKNGKLSETARVSKTQRFYEQWRK